MATPNSRQETSCADVVASLKQKDIFPAIVPVRMPFNYTVNRTYQGRNNTWWDKSFKAGWEHLTFAIFRQFLTPNTVHIDFGAWIGPTVLFAAKIAKRVIAFECDPYAELELIANVRVNSNFSHKVSVSSLCISDQVYSTEMAGRGASGSVISTVGEKHFKLTKNSTKTSWTVQCVPLLKILEEQKLLDGNSDLFIKIDTEGAETIILPSFYEWISQLDSKTKPTIYVSMHLYMTNIPESSAGIKAILRTFSLFKYATPVGYLKKKTGTSWTESFLVSNCLGCSIILTDKEYSHVGHK